MSSRLFLTILLLLPVSSKTQSQRRLTSDAGLSTVIGVLSKAHSSGSLEYRGSCSLDSDRFHLPQLGHAEQAGDDPVAILAELFKGDPQMRVSRDESGFVRMIEADIPTDLLKSRIRRIAFKNDHAFPPVDVRFDARDALAVILSTPDVTQYMEAHQIEKRFPVEFVNERRSMPSPEVPHLPDNVNDVTLSEALDSVVKTFPGLWIYENCPSKDGKRVVDFAIY